VAGSDVDAGSTSAASTVFGVGVLLAAIGLIGLGSFALRLRRGPTAWAVLPLVLGLFQLLVVTPVSFALGFASPGSFVVIALADLLTVLIGVGLLHGSVADASHEAAQPQAM
jgi:hypothetical protein